MSQFDVHTKETASVMALAPLRRGGCIKDRVLTIRRDCRGACPTANGTFGPIH